MKLTRQFTLHLTAIILTIVAISTGCKQEITRQADWEADFTNLHFVAPRHGWIVGTKGMIIHTSNAGKTWERQESGADRDFLSVYFTNTRNGWAVGDGGLIATTGDGGRHWYLQESGSHAILRSVYFANSNEGWIVGEGADVLYTQDGGKLWKRHRGVSEFPLNAVNFVGKQKGWAVGGSDRILYTPDGGKRWREQTYNIIKGNHVGRINEHRGVLFISPTHGWIAASDGKILHTTNGGVEWTHQESRIPFVNGTHVPSINTIHFANGNQGIAVANFGFINYTKDGGENWQLVQESGTDNNLTAAQFTGENEVWAVGDFGTILHSTDGGESWRLASGGKSTDGTTDSGTVANDLHEVQFASANRAVAVGKRGTIAVSEDGGQTWTDIKTRIWDQIAGLYFVSDKEGWAVGERGLIVHTIDGGLTWEHQTSGTAFRLNAVYFATPKRGWAVGDVGAMLHTIDGGKTWVHQNPGVTSMFKGVFFRNENEGWVVGWPGIALHTTNGGLTWTQQHTGTYNELYGIYFVDSTVGWIVGQWGEILHTKDAGKTWRFQRSGTEATLNQVYFADTSHGLIVGDDGVILTTANSGTKWQLQKNDRENDLYGFAFSPNGMLAVGEGGIATRFTFDEVEQLPVELPPLAEEIEVVEEAPIIEEVTYQWEIVRQATWRTNFTDVYFHRRTSKPPTLPDLTASNSPVQTEDKLSVLLGWAVGSSGVIAHTTDGGKTWKPQHSGVDEDLRLITFVDAFHGWIAGSGVFLRTENGGKTWQLIPSALKGSRINPETHLTDSIFVARTMAFINAQEGWLGVDEGRILHTTDGGLTWKLHQTGMTPSPITDIHFINGKEGWAVAPQVRNGGWVFHTVDGGDSWQILSRTNYPGIGVHFADTKSGWIVMGNGRSLITADGGLTWQLQPGSETGRMQHIKFRNHKEAWGLGRNNAIFMTHDHGKSWTRRDVILDDEESRMTSFGVTTNVHFVNDRYGWAASESGHIYHTSDGGKVWARQLGERQDSFHDVLFLNDTHGWIAGESGVLLETQDGGQTWNPLHSGTQQALIGVHFTDVRSKWGWTMRRDGTVIYTTNGQKWSVGQPPVPPPLELGEVPAPFVMNDVAFGAFSEGWAVGNHGHIIHNQDGGPTWTVQRTSTADDLIGLDMKFAPLGWAVGRSGIVQRTINGGEYWKYHETNTGQDLHAVSFATKRKGWVAGQQGIILRTTGGGFHWEAISSGVTKDLYDILALSEDEIYTVGVAGVILHSRDGGTTWQQQHTDIDNDLYTIVLANDGNTLWVVGQWGVVLRRQIGPVKMSMR